MNAILSPQLAPPIVALPNFRGPEFIDGLKKLTVPGMDSVCIRAFAVDRIEQAQRTGSDRDANSTIFDVSLCDSTPAVRDQYHIEASQVTYLLPVKGLSSESPSVDYGEVHLPLAQAVDTQVGGGQYDANLAYLVYDASKIQKAPDAWVEFWLPKQHPEQALLGILVAQSAWQPQFGNPGP